MNDNKNMESTIAGPMDSRSLLATCVYKPTRKRNYFSSLDPESELTPKALNNFGTFLVINFSYAIWFFLTRSMTEDFFAFNFFSFLFMSSFSINTFNFPFV